MEENNEKKKGNTSLGIGLLILVVGVLWLLKDFGFLTNVPFIPVLLIFVGVWVTGKALMS